MSTQTNEPIVQRGTQRMLWFSLHSFILDRSLPVPDAISFHPDGNFVWLRFREDGAARRWAASLGWAHHDSVVRYSGDLQGWRVYVNIAGGAS